MRSDLLNKSRLLKHLIWLLLFFPIFSFAIGEPTIAQEVNRWADAEKQDATLMMSIALCEGRTHLLPNGKVVKGKVNSKDIGLFQINEKYHLKKSKELGYDIYSLSGNIRYAIHLLKTEGTKPWSASKKCWSKITNYQLSRFGLTDG